MSLLELTQNCFQSGISAKKWLELSKLFIAKHEQSDAEVQNNITNSVLHLYRSYPGDPELQEYLKCAIQDGIVSVTSFVTCLLHRVAQSSELHHPVTLDVLIRLALDANLSGALYSDSTTITPTTLQDALVLLSTSYSFHVQSHFHQVSTSASELVATLISHFNEISAISRTQAMHLAAIINDLLSSFTVPADLRHLLYNFRYSLNLTIGDDSKAFLEAQMIHPVQPAALGKQDNLGGANSNTDIVTLSLELHYLVSFRASQFGAGSSDACVALLLATFRWSRSWTPGVFYTQLLVSAFVCLSQSSPSSCMLWKSFIVGRLPHLLVAFEKVTSSQPDSTTADVDWRGAMQAAIAAVFRRPELLSHCELTLSKSKSSFGSYAPQSLWRDFVQQLLATELLDQRFAVAVDPSIANDTTSRLKTDAEAAGVDLESYITSQLGELGLEDVSSWFKKVIHDPGCHSVYAEAVSKAFNTYATSLDVEALSHLCKILQTHEATLDILALQQGLTKLVTSGLQFLEDYFTIAETIGDPQAAFAQVGEVVLFLQSVSFRFSIPADSLGSQMKPLYTWYLKLNEEQSSLQDLIADDTMSFNAWFRTLFDHSSEGIDDSILRSTKPKTLLHISPILFCHALAETQDGNLDGDAFNNGVSYFTTPLLNWTLVGVIRALIVSQHRRRLTKSDLEILRTLLLSDACPRSVLLLCGHRVLTLLSGKQAKELAETGVDIAPLVERISQVVQAGDADPLPTNALPWQQARQAIQQSLTMARAGKAPFLDIDRCLKLCQPSKFLHILWKELVSAASIDTENCRRLATFILTIPRTFTRDVPPLLPIFLHTVVLSLVSTIESQQPAEQTMSIDFLVTLITSVMSASLHLELAASSVGITRQGNSSASMARRLATDLRTSPMQTCRVIAQRLSSSQSFVTNFPMFIGELAV